MQKIHITRSAQETRDIAHTFARTLHGGEVVLLEGDLGSGKTTFTQGLLEALGAQKPYTSPTFVICKSYDLQNGKWKMENEEQEERNEKRKTEKEKNSPFPIIHTVHHIDTYRIESKDLVDLGWHEMIADPRALTILEWPERVRDILPETAKKIFFAHTGENERKIRWEESSCEK